MTGKQKMWLKVLLTVTFPIWCVPYMLFWALILALDLVWEAVSELID